MATPREQVAALREDGFSEDEIVDFIERTYPAPTESQPAETSLPRQFVAGGMRGLGSLGGLAADAISGRLIDKSVMGLLDEEAGAAMPSFTDSTTRIVTPLAAAVAGREPNTMAERFASNAGEFAPGMMFPGGTAYKAASSLLGAAGQTVGEEVAPNSPATQTALAIAAGGIPDLLSVGRGLVRAIAPGPEEIARKVGTTLRDEAGLSVQALENAARAKASGDGFLKLQTTAELTDNPMLAGLENAIGKEPRFSGQFSALDAQRSSARDQIMSELAPGPVPSDEEMGLLLRGATQSSLDSSKKNVDKLFKAVDPEGSTRIPMRKPIYEARDAQQTLASADSLNRELPSEARKLIDNAAEVINSSGGALNFERAQNLRSSAGEFASEFFKKGKNKAGAVMASLVSGIDEAVERAVEKGEGITAEQAAIWRAGRDAHNKQRGTFGKGMIASTVLGERVEPERIVSKLYDASSVATVRKLKTALKDQPQVIDSLRRATLEKLSYSTRDRNNKITLAGIQKALRSKSGVIKELFGPPHLRRLERIADDLTSEARKLDNVIAPSKGQAFTTQGITTMEYLRSSAGEALLSKVPGLGFISKMGAGKRQKVLEDMIFNVAMDPMAARDLVAKASQSRLTNLLPVMSKFALSQDAYVED